jgi:cystathionine beta-lyase family protein involved in aluminum resistance
VHVEFSSKARQWGIVALIPALFTKISSRACPVPSEMHGYESELVMVGGTFIDGSTSEFSADGPLREPDVVFCQGGTHWTHVAIALVAAIEAVGMA